MIESVSLAYRCTWYIYLSKLHCLSPFMLAYAPIVTSPHHSFHPRTLFSHCEHTYLIVSSNIHSFCHLNIRQYIFLWLSPPAFISLCENTSNLFVVIHAFCYSSTQFLAPDWLERSLWLTNEK